MKQSFNLRPSDCKFIIDKEKRKVVCVLYKTSHFFLDFLEKNSHINIDFFDYYGQSLYSQLLMPDRFMGIATCSDDDEWNEECGRAIAFSRLKDKVNKSFFKRANTYVNTIDRWLDEDMVCINKFGMKLEKNQEKRHNYIEQLINTKTEDGQ